MRRWLRARKWLIWVSMAGVLGLAAASGFLTSTALGQGKTAPSKTVTIDVATGPAGPTGPPGPPGAAGPTGPAGSSSCPAGFTAGELVINAPGGHVTLFTCLQDNP